METILCLSSYSKGHEFLRECAENGARTILITVEKLRDADWPRDMLAELYLLPTLDNVEHVINAVSYLARTERFSRIVALDEFDMELAATLREHLRVPGLGVTATRAVRDKLTMRELTRDAGLAVPEFTGMLNHDVVSAFMESTDGPWVLKPRSQASAIGIRKVHEPSELWPLLETLGDRQSHHLLERYIPGNVYHVDGIVADGAMKIMEVHRYAQPPFDVMHAGGVFCSRTVQRGGEEEAALREQTTRLVSAVGLRNGAVHAEFIRAADTGVYYFLEIAARVGGAHIADMVHASAGVDLWREWARLELALARNTSYTPPQFGRAHAGVLISLARQEWPDTSAYDDPEIVWRLRMRHHAGLVVAAPEAARVEQLLDTYLHRFHADFYTSMPAPDRATQ
ncbi:MAG TPA: ATP-grasp domain-containing protein [Longimicrobiales bacterium]|nr:ATP-grasp domain-containing protein [Longimicrobiales bacterium]